jgi:DNA repair protein REV1
LRRHVFSSTSTQRLTLTLVPVSIGVSHNILLARLATRRAKPAGSYHLVPADVPEFLAPLDIADLHGFGGATKQKAMEKLGTTKLGEILRRSKAFLCDMLGRATGETLYNAIRGVDEKRLESDKPRKSVSCDISVSYVVTGYDWFVDFDFLFFVSAM